MRKHGSLTKDEEINEASWVAAKGAAVGAAKVRTPASYNRGETNTHFQHNYDSDTSSGGYSQQWRRPQASHSVRCTEA